MDVPTLRLRLANSGLFERVESLLRFVDGAGASRDVFPWVTFSRQSTGYRFDRIRLRVR